ncbi:hypothetical protein LGH82_03125 [Mesorhizobium sp. PAMC28654]|uniref:hypothetical protein n=1 Tax=Mesorhizobium sp. PAMC28654 TaxID=2880934 RepID=UPI001D0AF68D|nr:hypothetical protein [Mesorhizobium sp. PAMC28654]UDL90383.1 hypothetical protein LGH82_03125 [Mesorhizobium sp. PAMC28654]
MIRYAQARDLAAHMLLHLDDLSGCWSIATNWLRAEFGCQRVDTGFGVREAKDYFPGFAEAKDTDYDVLSFGGGKAVDNRDVAMQAMWLDPRPVIFADIKQDSRITMRLRQRLSGARTKSKFAWALRTERGSLNMSVCSDVIKVDQELSSWSDWVPVRSRRSAAMREEAFFVRPLFWLYR